MKVGGQILWGMLYTYLRNVTDLLSAWEDAL